MNIYLASTRQRGIRIRSQFIEFKSLINQRNYSNEKSNIHDIHVTFTPVNP